MHGTWKIYTHNFLHVILKKLFTEQFWSASVTPICEMNVENKLLFQRFEMKSSFVFNLWFSLAPGS